MGWFKNIFKKKVNINSNSLINLDDLIDMPEKKFYVSKDKEIKKYISYYKELLKSDRYLTSVDFQSEVTINNYINSITKTIIELDYIMNLVNNSDKRNNVDLEIILSKLKYYVVLLNNYKEDLFIRWKALDIVSRRNIINVNKRDAIYRKINSIKNELIIINSNTRAINLEVSSYLDLISISNITLVNNEDEMIRNKFNKLKSYLYLFGIDNENIKELGISNIVYMEVMLENYLSSHDVINDIKSLKIGNIESIDEGIKKCIFLKEFSTTYVDDLLNDLIDRKFKYYEIKFKVKPISDYVIKYNSVYEHDYLENIIYKYINEKNISRDIKNIIFYDREVNSILKDSFKLSLLFNGEKDDYKNWFYKMLEYFKVPTSSLYNYLEPYSNSSICKKYGYSNYFASDVSLLTILRMFDHKYKLGNNLEELQKEYGYYFNIYKVFNMLNKEMNYVLPFRNKFYDGFKIVDFDEFNFDANILLNEVFSDFRENTIYFGKDVEYVYIGMSENTIFNTNRICYDFSNSDKLKKIVINNDTKRFIRDLVLPTSVKDIEVINGSIGCVKFTDLNRAYILNDKVLFDKFIFSVLRNVEFSQIFKQDFSLWITPFYQISFIPFVNLKEDNWKKELSDRMWNILKENLSVINNYKIR